MCCRVEGGGLQPPTQSHHEASKHPHGPSRNKGTGVHPPMGVGGTTATRINPPQGDPNAKVTSGNPGDSGVAAEEGGVPTTTSPLPPGVPIPI